MGDLEAARSELRRAIDAAPSDAVPSDVREQLQSIDESLAAIAESRAPVAEDDTPYAEGDAPARPGHIEELVEKLNGLAAHVEGEPTRHILAARDRLAAHGGAADE